MTFPLDPINTSNDFIPENWEWPETDTPEFLYEIKRRYRRISSNLNNREIGIFDLAEYLTGEQWFDPGNTQIKRQTFRKVVQTGPVVTGLNIIPHGIPFPAVVPPLSNWRVTNVHGTLTDPTQPQPVDPAVINAPIPNSTTLLELTNTNIRLTIPATYNNWDGIVVIEYLKN